MNEMMYFHLLMIDKLVFATEDALQLLINDHKNLSKALDMLEERSAIMDIIDHLQKKIEAGLSMKGRITIEEIEKWESETSSKYKLLDKLDQSIVEELNLVKDEISKEISATVCAKNGLKGYNANSVK